MIRDNSLIYGIVEEIVSFFSEPIDFSTCSIPRRALVIPTDVEYGYNYKDFKKFNYLGKAA
jgi:hypothetical protein